MAEIREEIIHATRGREEGLEIASRLYIVLGFVGFVVGIIISAATGVLWWILAGIFMLFLGVSFSLAYSAQAEVIRLLKAHSGMLYSGKVSGNEMSRVYICSECGTSNWTDVPVCRKCMAAFEKKES
ncbi:hypothetical protein EG829_18000 [bacterium]|nr:hypothetical protein [bacterium]